MAELQSDGAITERDFRALLLIICRDQLFISTSCNCNVKKTYNCYTKLAYSVPNQVPKVETKDVIIFFFFFWPFNDDFSVSRLYRVGWYNDRWMMSLKAFGRKWLWPNRGAIQEYAWIDWRKQWETSVRVASVPAEIRDEHLPNTSLERYL
jgi:hypothetical protein